MDNRVSKDPNRVGVFTQVKRNFATRRHGIKTLSHWWFCSAYGIDPKIPQSVLEHCVEANQIRFLKIIACLIYKFGSWISPEDCWVFLDSNTQVFGS